MMLTLVRVRLLQARREVQALGLLYTLLFAGLLALAVVAAHRQYQQLPSAWYIAGAVVGLAAMAKLLRPDQQFVFTHLPRPHLSLFAEYALLSLPLTVPCLFTRQWYLFPVMVAGLALVAGLRVQLRGRTRFRWLSRIIHPREFEWLSGLRASLPGLLLLHALALGFCWVRVLPLFLLWFATVIIASFYQECEPLPVLRAAGQAPVPFLLGKLKRHARLLWLVYLPVLVAATLFHPGLWYVHLAFAVLQLPVLAFAILLKYSTYTPGRMHSANSLLLFFAAAGSLVPFLLPLPLVLCVRHWFKARQRLALYLDA